MDDLYIDWEMENTATPYNKVPQKNLVDKSLVFHLICNINPPGNMTAEELHKDPVLKRVLEELEKMPSYTLDQVINESFPEKRKESA